MRRLIVGLLIFSACVAYGPARSNPDGSGKMICVVTSTTEFICTAANGCAQGAIKEGSLSGFLRVDLNEKTVTSTKPDNKDLVTPIHFQQVVGGRLILAGVDDGIGWMATISIQTGEMALTLSDPEMTNVIFGECTGL